MKAYKIVLGVVYFDPETIGDDDIKWLQENIHHLPVEILGIEECEIGEREGRIVYCSCGMEKSYCEERR